MTGIRVSLAIAAVELRRFLADRSNIFFVFIFPLVLVVVIGASFGGSGPSASVAIAGADSPLRSGIVQQLTQEDAADVSYASEDAIREQVARGRTDAGLLISAEAATAFDEGQDVDLPVLVGSSANSQIASQTLRGAVASANARRDQMAALDGDGRSEAEIEAALDAAEEQLTPATLQVERGVDEISAEFEGLSGRFDQGAASQLLLFVFLASLTGSATLIQGRRYGVVGRVLAAPVTSGQVLMGQALGRFTIAAFQGIYIMIATSLIFAVNWGSWPLALLVLVVFSTVAAGAAMILGSLIDNEGAAAGLGVGLGLILGAIGGCMFPLEFFGDTMRNVAHITPHAWAYDAMADVQRRDASLVDILPELGVLAAMSVVLLVIGAWALRRSTARAM
ncbi:MAG: ABC transporter permease [Ornithinimicrobium sp.]